MVITLIKFETNLKIRNECIEDTRYLLRKYISPNISIITTLVSKNDYFHR